MTPTFELGPVELTPVRYAAGTYIKRDDLFGRPGGHGGKMRTCLTLALQAQRQRGRTLEGLVTASSRHSPQAAIVAGVADLFGIPARIHVPAGPTTPELAAAADLGAEIVGHRPGHNSVIVARARTDALEHDWLEVPFGMETPLAVELTAQQTANVPAEVTRIVVAVGSGMSAAGIVTGLQRAGRQTPVVGIAVGADPTKRLDRWAPLSRATLTLERPTAGYHDAIAASHAGIPLDPHYEAKAASFLTPGDLFWIVGRRTTLDMTGAPT